MAGTPVMQAVSMSSTSALGASKFPSSSSAEPLPEFSGLSVAKFNKRVVQVRKQNVVQTGNSIVRAAGRNPWDFYGAKSGYYQAPSLEKLVEFVVDQFTAKKEEGKDEPKDEGKDEPRVVESKVEAKEEPKVEPKAAPTTYYKEEPKAAPTTYYKEEPKPAPTSYYTEEPKTAPKTSEPEEDSFFPKAVPKPVIQESYRQQAARTRPRVPPSRATSRGPTRPLARTAVREAPKPFTYAPPKEEPKPFSWEAPKEEPKPFSWESPKTEAKSWQAPKPVAVVDDDSFEDDIETDPKLRKVGNVVLVTGATGGVGRRVVELLRKRGVNVRALVRNKRKARQLLGPSVDLVAADITQKATLLPEYFVGVNKVIHAASVTIGPKEGDTPDRKKYLQGIKFYDPEVKGDTPETVEYIGMRNLLDVLKDHVGVAKGKTLFAVDASGQPVGTTWESLDDRVMGGVSESALEIKGKGGENEGPVGLFRGVVSTKNNGGFVSIKTKNIEPPQDLSAYEGLDLRVKGNGARFKLVVRDSPDSNGIGYTASFDTVGGVWQSIRLPFKDFKPVLKGKTVFDGSKLNTTNIVSLQLMFSKFDTDGKLNPAFGPGYFQLPIAAIKTYLKEPATPRFVHISSAGVTRPDKPGLDLSKQPPAVRLNKQLGNVLTFKLKGEDLVRASDIPFTVIRPCALTEEPAGAELQFDQGDTITGKISRDEVARIAVAALDSPSATAKTFEVKSKVPVDVPYVGDARSRGRERNYTEFFKALKSGITGKQASRKATPPKRFDTFPPPGQVTFPESGAIGRHGQPGLPGSVVFPGGVRIPAGNIKY